MLADRRAARLLTGGADYGGRPRLRRRHRHHRPGPRGRPGGRRRPRPRRAGADAAQRGGARADRRRGAGRRRRRPGRRGRRRAGRRVRRRGARPRAPFGGPPAAGPRPVVTAVVDGDGAPRPDADCGGEGGPRPGPRARPRWASRPSGSRSAAPSSRRSCWGRGLSATWRRATLVRDGVHELTADADPGLAPTGPVRGWLHEPDPAVIRSGLVACVAADLGATLIDPTIAYLTSDARAASPWVSSYRITDVLPFNLKKLKAHLRTRGIGRVVVKKRGSPIEPETLARQLRGPGSGSAVVVVTRVAGAPTVAGLRPAQRDLTSPAPLAEAAEPWRATTLLVMTQGAGTTPSSPSTGPGRGHRAATSSSCSAPCSAGWPGGRRPRACRPCCPTPGPLWPTRPARGERGVRGRDAGPAPSLAPSSPASWSASARRWATTAPRRCAASGSARR